MRLRTASVCLGLTLGLVLFSASSSNAQQSSVQPAEPSRKVVSRVAPLYPDLAKKMQISGTVRVEATVAPNGRVKSTKVIGGSPVLTKAVLDALQSWKWQSASSESKELIELTFRPE